MSGVASRLASIEAIILDVDGVLTDGRLYYGADGEEMKSFHVRDGLGLALLRECGLRRAIVSGPELDHCLEYLQPGCTSSSWVHKRG